MRKAYTVNLDTTTWEMLHKLAAAWGVPKSRVLDMAVLHLHECKPDADGKCAQCIPQRDIKLFGEEE
jgi:hypothetical protein